MTPFRYHRAGTEDEALRAGCQPGAIYLGGGTNLIDLMREGIARPSALVDVTPLSATISETADGSLIIGAAAKNSDVANHPVVLKRHRLLAEAILNGASAQIRNMATVAGNLLQRTRCPYFYDDTARCNKREPTMGCDAIHGHNRGHAILGASDHCVATHPSDMCVALAALDTLVHVRGAQGDRSVPFSEFHQLPNDTPHLDTSLADGELIVGVELRPGTAAHRTAYRKVRERSSYAFALVAVAVAVEMRDGKIADARLALGGVASKPWRVHAAEQMVVGRPPTESLFESAAAALLAGARPLNGNAFKVELAARLIVRTLAEVTQPEQSS